jgi:hypothetical protein
MSIRGDASFCASAPSRIELYPYSLVNGNYGTCMTLCVSLHMFNNNNTSVSKVRRYNNRICMYYTCDADGSLMMMTFWYYRPDDIQSQNPTTECVGVSYIISCNDSLLLQFSTGIASFINVVYR